MDEPQDAAENLRVIRKLMERATTYRAISAPTALAAAGLTLPVSIILILLARDPGFELGAMAYFWIWVAVFLAVDSINALFLWRDARRRETSMISPGFCHAVAAIVPPLFTGGLISLLLVHESFLLATLCWVVFYGLSLLATQSFAPTSIKTLGAVFVVAGLLIGIAARLGTVPMSLESDLRVSALVMAFTFGLFHLAYALIVGLKTRFRISHEDPVLS